MSPEQQKNAPLLVPTPIADLAFESVRINRRVTLARCLTCGALTDDVQSHAIWHAENGDTISPSLGWRLLGSTRRVIVRRRGDYLHADEVRR